MNGREATRFGLAADVNCLLPKVSAGGLRMRVPLSRRRYIAVCLGAQGSVNSLRRLSSPASNDLNYEALDLDRTEAEWKKACRVERRSYACRARMSGSRLSGPQIVPHAGITTSTGQITRRLLGALPARRRRSRNSRRAGRARYADRGRWAGQGASFKRTSFCAAQGLNASGWTSSFRWTSVCAEFLSVLSATPFH
jgi:hypothetical protein